MYLSELETLLWSAAMAAAEASPLETKVDSTDQNGSVTLDPTGPIISTDQQQKQAEAKAERKQRGESTGCEWQRGANEHEDVAKEDNHHDSLIHLVLDGAYVLGRRLRC